MRRVLLITITAVAAFLFAGCRSTYPAMSERSYQYMTQCLSDELAKDGFTLVEKSGKDEEERYSFSNQKGETLEYTIEFNRDEYKNVPYIEEVNMKECKTSNATQYERYCGKFGTVERVLVQKRKLDATGARVDGGKTAGLIVGASVAYVALMVGIILAVTK